MTSMPLCFPSFRFLFVADHGTVGGSVVVWTSGSIAGSSGESASSAGSSNSKSIQLPELPLVGPADLTHLIAQVVVSRAIAARRHRESDQHVPGPSAALLILPRRLLLDGPKQSNRHGCS